jgi:peroxiredoxin
MAAMDTDYSRLPTGLPIPEDDGGADHLTGMALPEVRLASTLGKTVDLSKAAESAVDVAIPAAYRQEARHLVIYAYPRTGTPGEPSPTGWDDIPGARGCTPQSCAYRDSLAEFSALGAAVIGISVQSAAEQAEFAAREHIPFPLLSDRSLRLAKALRLPTFEVNGMTLYKRLTLIVEQGKISKVFYPVFPPDRNAAEVLAWLRDRAA